MNKIATPLIVLVVFFGIGFLVYGEVTRSTKQDAKQECYTAAKQESDRVRKSEADMELRGYSVTKQANYEAILNSEYEDCLKAQGL